MIRILVANALWLTVLCGVALAVSRQTLIIGHRVHLYGAHAIDGREVGEAVPVVGSLELPRAGLLIFLAPSCPPCETVAKALHKLDSRAPVHVVLNEKAGPSSPEFLAMLPPYVPVFGGSAAAAIRSAFRINREPLGVQIEAGVVIGKGVLRHERDIERLLSPVSS